MISQGAAKMSIVLNEHFEEDGASVYWAACQLGCEGIVSKRLGSPYRSGRSANWVKVKMKQRGRPFQKGHSGNPQGRPPGARNTATMMAEQLLDGEAEAITRKAIELAKQGDLTALRLCLDRLVPPRRDRPVNFALPAMSSAEDASFVVRDANGQAGK
jgi:hypothetical protein